MKIKMRILLTIIFVGVIIVLPPFNPVINALIGLIGGGLIMQFIWIPIIFKN